MDIFALVTNVFGFFVGLAGLIFGLGILMIAVKTEPVSAGKAGAMRVMVILMVLGPASILAGLSATSLYLSTIALSTLSIDIPVFIAPLQASGKLFFLVGAVMYIKWYLKAAWDDKPVMVLMVLIMVAGYILDLMYANGHGQWGYQKAYSYREMLSTDYYFSGIFFLAEADNTLSKMDWIAGVASPLLLMMEAFASILCAFAGTLVTVGPVLFFVLGIATGNFFVMLVGPLGMAMLATIVSPWVTMNGINWPW